MNDPITLPWREKAARAGWNASAALPLIRHEQAIGVFMLYSTEVDAFDEDTRKLLLEMATDIGFAAGDVRAREEAQGERRRVAEALTGPRTEPREWPCITDAKARIEYNRLRPLSRTPVTRAKN